ncbi:hypothetical protein [Shewanella sp. NIFS-20-20]|uniref:hypothetical protein n=1 Tax=Shewanella sp. NIFS-20-20 TaxID=2853806 RepID=UPI001C458306|nr:hypothetical protein [Shewanella sp. NIFS-20-20]MBV7316767.1 hypothetical protein [Shewanella sp. NIFS-20-20]
MIIANMATYPAREEVIKITVPQVAKQVDKLVLCLNEFKHIPEFLKSIPNVEAVIPDEDFKDVGKFISEYNAEDDVFYVDDDIIYPDDYIEYSMHKWQKYASLNPIIGYHGVIYSDFFDGNQSHRNVFTFKLGLKTDRMVNQLGTGTIHCKGWQCPKLDFMRGSQKYVDLRFAVHSKRSNYPMICVERDKGWMKEIETLETIYEGFTKKWPPKVTLESQEIAGYSKFDFSLMMKLNEIKKYEC